MRKPGMKTSPAGLALIQEFESCKLQAYPDANGVATIGWGHTLGVKESDCCRQEQADAWLAADLAKSEECVSMCILSPLNQSQFDALVSLAFNIGCHAFNTSTLARLLNGGHYHDAAKQFTLWAHVEGKLSAGLERRRVAEQRLFLGSEVMAPKLSDRT